MYKFYIRIIGYVVLISFTVGAADMGQNNDNKLLQKYGQLISYFSDMKFPAPGTAKSQICRIHEKGI